jgi:hypothetical protein
MYAGLQVTVVTELRNGWDDILLRETVVRDCDGREEYPFPAFMSRLKEALKQTTL